MINSRYKLTFLYILISVVIVVLTRTSFRIAYNVEFITAFSIAAGFYFRDKKLSILVPLVSVFISDLLIGNTNIYLFTWSAFLLAPFAGIILEKFQIKNSNLNLLVGGSISGFASTMLFFFWTNFGVVVLTNMYQKNIEGLISSYINALPFLQNQLIGNIILTPIILISMKYIFNFTRNIKEESFSNKNIVM